MIHSNKEEQDRLCIEAWRSLLLEFHAIQKTYSKKDNEKLIKLKEKAKANPYLTFRQLDAINARCDNVMSGLYGNTKTDEQMNHSKPSGKKAA